MTSILASRPNAYTGSPLDRAAHLRDDADWIAASFAALSSAFVPVWRAKSLIDGDDSLLARRVPGAAADGLRRAAGAWAFLGLEGGTAVFAVDVSSAEEPLALLDGTRGRFEDLRTLAGRLPEHEAAILAHARGLMHWRTRHGFCGVCGAPCEPRSAGHALACPKCGAQHFPRTDPAVIMLVHRHGRALLANSQRFPDALMHSTLAGFVEPGESLEEAVAREVMEEVGVPVGPVRYHSSQPWPFPASIMLGFYAEGLADPITIQPDEIRAAAWFTRDQLRDPDAHGFKLPRRDSIARRLIEDWMEQE